MRPLVDIVSFFYVMIFPRENFVHDFFGTLWIFWRRLAPPSSFYGCSSIADRLRSKILPRSIKKNHHFFLETKKVRTIWKKSVKFFEIENFRSRIFFDLGFFRKIWFFENFRDRDFRFLIFFRKFSRSKKIRNRKFTISKNRTFFSKLF